MKQSGLLSAQWNRPLLRSLPVRRLPVTGLPLSAVNLVPAGRFT